MNYKIFNLFITTFMVINFVNASLSNNIDNQPISNIINNTEVEVQISDIMRELEKACPKIIKEKIKLDEAPEKKFFGKDKRDYEKKITKQVNDLYEKIFDENLDSDLIKIKEINNQIKDYEFKIAEIKIKIVDSELHDKRKKIKSYEKDIAKLNEKITNAKNEIERLEFGIKKRFKSLNYELSDQEFLLLSSRIDGNEFLKMMTMYQMFLKVFDRSELYMKFNTENINLIKKYYGVYVVLNELNIFLKDSYVKKVNEYWIPKIEDYIDKADKLVVEQSAAIRSIDNEGIKKNLEINLNFNKRAKNTAEAYKKMLNDQTSLVLEEIKLAKKHAFLAWSTYKTTDLSVDLISDMMSSNNDLLLITKITVPQAIDLNDTVIKSAFNDITAQLEIE